MSAQEKSRLQTIKHKILGDPSICIISFKIKVAIINTLLVLIAVNVISWITNINLT